MWLLFFNRYTLAALAVAAVVFTIYEWGSNATLEKVKRQGAAAAEKYRKDTTEWEGVKAKLKSEADARETVIKQQAAELLEANNKRRGSYVTPKATAACGKLSTGFVLQHNADANGTATLPNPSGVDRPSVFDLADLSLTIGKNYSACHVENAKRRNREASILAACKEYDRKWGTDSNCDGSKAAKSNGEPASR